MRRLRLWDGGALDWALATSPEKRDVFYYGNLPIGESLVAELLSFEREPAGEGGRAPSRRQDAHAPDACARRQPIADVITRRIFVAGAT